VLASLSALSQGLQTLERAYEDAISRLKSQLPGDAALAVQVLTWIVYAERPLTTTELCHALAIEVDKASLDFDNLLDIEDIVSVCAGLVTIDEDSDIVRLVHYTTQEYFESIRTDWNPTGRSDITRTCLTYLSFDTFRRGTCSDSTELTRRLNENPLLDYASRCWGKSAITAQDDIFDLACSVLLNNNIVSCILQVLTHARHETLYPGQSLGTGLHVLAELGLRDMAERMLTTFDSDAKSWILEKDFDGRTSLYVAVEHGYESMVKLLLDKGADPNAYGGDFSYPINEAVYSKNERIVQLLIDNGALVNRGARDPDNTLKLAFQEGSEKMVKLLLNAGADVSKTDTWMRTPLRMASEEGWYELVTFLLGQTSATSRNARDLDGWTPLSKACFNNHVEVVKLLLDNGTDANISVGEGWTPLHTAADQGHLEVVRLLLDNGADLNAHDTHGRTPIHSAMSKYMFDVVELLLKKGADVDVLDESARTLLNKASKAGRIGVVGLLLEQGADVDMPSERGWRTIHNAADSGHLEMLKLLLENGASIDMATDDKATPITIASIGGHVDAVKLLLDKGADATLTSCDRWAPLMLAAYHGHKEITKLLLPTCTDFYNTMDSGLGPLGMIASQGWTDILKLVQMQYHANLQFMDSHNRTLLHTAARAGQLDTCLYLVGQGVDVSARDAKGDGLLSYAALSDSLEVLEMALSMVSVSAVQDGHWNPLHWSCRAGHSHILEKLARSGLKGIHVTGSGLEDDWSPMDIAIYHGHEHMLDDLSDFCKIALGPVAKSGRVPGTYQGGVWCDGCSQVSDLPGLFVLDLLCLGSLWPTFPMPRVFRL
jgi:ankyrin repeat protein